MKADYTQRDDEYSKGWAADHPALFTASVLEFLEQHPTESWTLAMEQTKGFFKLRETVKE